MNKYQKALEDIKNESYTEDNNNYCDCGCGGETEVKVFDEGNENIKIIEELVDRATPKKPTGLSVSHEGRLGNCPNCNKRVYDYIDITHHQDEKCLQRIDWSNSDEKIR